jgi:hypothetical protein
LIKENKINTHVHDIFVLTVFYDLLKGAQKYHLEFSIDENDGGPHWNDEGTAMTTETSSQ